MKLAPSRDGLRLAALDQGRVRVLDLAGATPEVAAPLADASDVVLFENQLWVVAGEPPVLRRMTLDLRETGRVALPPGRGLVRAAYGAPAALWLPEPGGRAQVVTDGPAVAPLGVDHLATDLLVPVSAQRVIRFRDGELGLFDAQSGPRWTHSLVPENRAVGIGPLFEGRAIAVALEQHLVVLDLRDGRLQHRLALQGVTGARFTALRGLAVLSAGPHQLIVVDLRFGKVLRQHHEARAILDLALDDAGQHLVLRFAGDEVVDMRVADLVAGRVAGDASRDDDEPANDEAVTDVVAPSPSFSPEPEPPPRRAAPVELADPGGPLAGLAPRPAVARTTAAESRRMLDHYRELVAAFAARAVARGWDSGSLAFADESRRPFEREVAAIAGGVRGLADEPLRGAEEVAARAHRGLREAEALLEGRMPPLAQLATELGLSPIAQHILLLVAAPGLWGELARLYGIVANDEHRALCDELLIQQLSGPAADRHAIAHALERDQPLVRHGLVRVGTERARPFATLTVDPLVLHLLRGDRVDTDLDETTEQVIADKPLEQLRLPRDEVARVVRALSVAPAHPVRLVVRGRVGTGRRSLIAALAARSGRPVGTIDAGRLLREQRLDVLGVLLRRTALRGWLPLVDGLELIASDDLATRERVRDLLREHPGPLAVRLPHDAVPPLPAGFIAIDLPTLNVATRADHWQATLAAAGLVVEDVDGLAARFNIGPGVIERVVGHVAATPPEPSGGGGPGGSATGEGGASPPGYDATRAIEHAVRQHLASRLGEIAQRVERLVNWSQVVLPADIQDSILELMARIRHRRTVYDTWGFDQVMSTSRGVTALFQGGPGTGKTLVAGAIANELGLDLYRIDLSRVMSKWIGETEQNLAKVFAAAEEGQAILLFDEADSLFAKRTEVRTSVDRYANLEVNYLLQRFDSFEGIAILTTNFGTAIDSAFKRRLSFRLTFPFPDDETRELLWKAHLPEALPRQGELDLADLARRYRMSGGYIRNAALRAAFLAAEERSPLTQDHLERAIRAEFREIGKLADSGVLE